MTSASAALPLPDLPEAIRGLVAHLGAEPSVRRVILFGSRARGDAGPRSDVDLAVEAPGLADWLWLADLTEQADTLLKIDLVRLEEAPTELRSRIEVEGRTLHER